MERFEALLGKALRTIHIIGGVTQDRLLCQFAADATGRQVIAGPVEATALGYALMLALALRHLASLSKGRQAIGKSFEMGPPMSLMEQRRGTRRTCAFAGW